jgi:hypothetical protein
MLRTFTRAAAIGGLLATAACGVIPIERTTHFYPSNDYAASGGSLTGRILGHGNLHGIAEVTMPDGEFLEGEYSIVAGGSAGIALASAGGQIGSGMFTNMSAGGNGEMDMRGPGGTSMTCEFANNNMTGHGFGQCQSSKGSTYRLTY